MTDKAVKVQLLAALTELIHPAPIEAVKAAAHMAKTLAFSVRKVHIAARQDPEKDPIKVFADAIDERTERKE